MNERLSIEMRWYDRLAEAIAYYCKATLPDLQERDDRIFIRFSDGSEYIIKDRGECDDVAIVRLSVLNETTAEAYHYITGK